MKTNKVRSYRGIFIESVGEGHYCAWVNFVEVKQPTAKGLGAIKKYVDLLIKCACDARSPSWSRSGLSAKGTTARG